MKTTIRALLLVCALSISAPLFAQSPTPVVVTDKNGNQLTITGATTGTQVAAPTPVVLTDKNGNALVLGTGGGSTGAPSLTTANLIADYTFTEGTGTTSADVSGAGAGPATLVNSPAWVTGGGVSCVAGSSQSITIPVAVSQAAVSVELYVNYQYSNMGAGVRKALIIGDGGGSTAAASGLGFDSSGSVFPNGNIGAGTPTSFLNGGYGTPYYGYFNGTGLITWVMGSSNDSIYLNGQLPILFSNAGTLANQGANSFHICGQAAGSGFATATYTTMTAYRARFFGAALPTKSVTSDNVGLAAIEAGNGFPVTTGATDQVAYHLCIGDSLTAGQSMTPSCALETLNNSMSVANRSAGGLTAATLLSEFPTYAPAQYRFNAPQSIFTLWACTNDLAGATTAAQCAGYQRQFCVLTHAIGPKCGLFTMISRTGLDANMASINPITRSLAAQSNPSADVIIDVAADPLLAPGASGGNGGTSSCYQVDHIHYTTDCSENHISPIENAGINSLFGNWSWGAANTYASAGGAAITVTASSESTNTMTFTSAGWTAATFVVGTRMFCTGITPSGYNGVWKIKTNTGTTVTAYNGTTGLGVGTIFGTCQGEQLQQADNYAKLNSGGNFLLSSCLDWVGRNVNLWNINGSSSTLIPFNSETFTGSTTVITNTIAIISSVLTSNTNGGCSLLRQQ